MKKVARFLRRVARTLDPPPPSFDDWEDEYECWGDERPTRAYTVHVCTEACPPTCRAMTKAIEEFRNHLDREMQRCDAIDGAMFSTGPSDVKLRDIRVPVVLKGKT